ncbi:unnamed protein product [Schistocephalus solidus]|uniref:Ion_trans domain-containing protein n=1 Tax=Schistocephalus solidus TaxID=70667 RepID=A0A183SZK4_SCHSO|nr:unnamed protein product [Schistocephalus solidus]
MFLIDPVMSEIVLAFWIATSMIVLLNLLIAMLTDAFQKVSDEAQSNAKMQQAITIIQLMEEMSEKGLRRFYDYLEEECNPYVKDYDDDEDDSTPDEQIIKHTVLDIMPDIDSDQDGGGDSGTKSSAVLQKMLEKDSQDLANQAVTLRSIQATLNKLVDYQERAEAKHKKIKGWLTLFTSVFLCASWIPATEAAAVKNTKTQNKSGKRDGHDPRMTPNPSVSVLTLKPNVTTVIFVEGPVKTVRRSTN